MVWTEVSAEAIVRDAISVITAALVPVAVVGIPALRAMPLPRALLDAVLFRCISRLLVASLFLVVPDLPLQLIVPVLPLLLGTVLRLIVLVLSLLLLSMLRLLPLFLSPLRLLPLLGLPLLLAMLLFGLRLLVLVLLLVGVTILFVFLVVLCAYRGSNPKK